MPNTKDIDLATHPTTFLLYGAFGSGKTHLAATLTDVCKRVYAFDLNDGLLTARNKEIEYDTYLDQTRNGVLVKTAYRQMQEKIRELEKSCPFDGIIVDDLASLADSVMRQCLHDTNKTDPNYGHWASVADNMRDLINELKRLHTKLVTTTLEEYVMILPKGMPQERLKETDVDLPSELEHWPMIIGRKLPKSFPPLFDEVWRMNVFATKVVTKYYALTVRGADYYAKSRLGVPNPVEDPAFGRIFDIVTKAAGGQQHPRE